MPPPLSHCNIFFIVLFLNFGNHLQVSFFFFCWRSAGDMIMNFLTSLHDGMTESCKRKFPDFRAYNSSFVQRDLRTMVESSSVHSTVKEESDQVPRPLLDHVPRPLDHVPRPLDHVPRPLDHVPSPLDHVSRPLVCKATDLVMCNVPPTTKSPVCTACRLPIEESLLMKVNDVFWHEQCLRCCLCNVPLSDSCFFDKNQRLYCKADHYQRILDASTCCMCSASISANDLVYRVHGRLYHIRCFTCSRCSSSLRKGDEYVLHGNGDLVCKGCSDEGLRDHFYLGVDPTCRRDRREVKRPRTVLSSVQRKVFKEAFDRTPRPCRKEREKLSSQTGLSVRVVQVWFQNQRAKVKKLARRKMNKQSVNSDSDMEERCLYDKTGESKVTSSVEGYPESITSPASCSLADQSYTSLGSPGGMKPFQNCPYVDIHSQMPQPDLTQPDSYLLPPSPDHSNQPITELYSSHVTQSSQSASSNLGDAYNSPGFQMDSIQKLHSHSHTFNGGHYYHSDTTGI
ncbi:LIM homeobox transcription factor 1-alpha-like [Bolinopsis microptera]|uniref:LIM homeobox transcription factor 1-alpha-like n=1 Tax=Bolinopsis microptera TaxID=2820187 RepID=UPI00307AE879